MVAVAFKITIVLCLSAAARRNEEEMGDHTVLNVMSHPSLPANLRASGGPSRGGLDARSNDRAAYLFLHS